MLRLLYSAFLLSCTTLFATACLEPDAVPNSCLVAASTVGDNVWTISGICHDACYFDVTNNMPTCEYTNRKMSPASSVQCRTFSDPNDPDTIYIIGGNCQCNAGVNQNSTLLLECPSDPGNGS